MPKTIEEEVADLKEQIAELQESQRETGNEVYSMIGKVKKSVYTINKHLKDVPNKEALKKELTAVTDRLNKIEEFLKPSQERREAFKFFGRIIKAIKENFSWILGIIVAILAIIKFFL